VGAVRPLSFHELLVESARAEGFPLAGAVDLELAYASPAGIEPHIERYRRWINAGHAGAMGYLVRGLDRRADPRLVLPEAKSVFCVLSPYPVRPAGAGDPARGPRYARYLQEGDYHASIAARLEAAMNRVAEAARAGGLPVPRWKVCVDTSAVLERSWAALAGLGWIGKNTLLIHPQLGSYLFIGTVLLDVETGQSPRPLADYCGNCARCLQACPTGAFRAPRELDSRRCVSYLTLEQRGEPELPEAERAGMGTWVAGCDVCQEVCPFNTKATRRSEHEPADAGATALADWRALLEEDEAAYRARVRESSLKRVKPFQFGRNLARALHNAAAALAPETRARLVPVVARRAEAETDAPARAEWQRCLQALTRQSPKRNP
jgi:epoxyqueuosine reductase